jgi:hypothetical protein
MINPIFAGLARDWGHQIRFIGVDGAQRVFDFRSLLTDSVLARLVKALSGQRPDDTLDVLFAALGDGMLTILEARRDDWPMHLARKHRIEPEAPSALYDRPARYPDFLSALRNALREELIDLSFYGRALRAIDQREQNAELRIAAALCAALDSAVLKTLDRLGTGRHLGCYNWLLLDARHSAQRAYVLSRLGCFAQFFADTLLPKAAPGAAAHGVEFAQWLARVVDTGQDRLVIGALAHRFGVAENTIRGLWRCAPAALGTPPTWQLAGILRRLDHLPERTWPKDQVGWETLMGHAGAPA